MSSQSSSSGVELKIVGRVLNTIGVVFLSICVALVGALYDNVSAMERTGLGLAFAAFMVIGGELLSRRLKSNWFPTTLMSSGYALAYFFIYATYYVPGLKMLADPYACWILGPTLAAIGTWHGTKNSSMRWFSSVFTLTVTGHALYHALTSTAVISIGGGSVKVAAVACFAGMLWCSILSAIYKRLELGFNWPGKTVEESANWMLNRVLHEGYFVLAALNAMALPLFLSSFEQAPLWWAIQAPILLALSWRSGNIIKHIVVAGMWLAAAGTMLNSAYHHAVALQVLVSVPLAGAAMSMAYRYLRSNWTQVHKVTGYCGYLYASIAIALAVPYLQSGAWDAMPAWMIESLVICGLGLALRDRIVHQLGFVTGLAALGLFGMQYNTWNWSFVAPVIACSYALSVAYGVISNKGGWKKADFLPFENESTVTAQEASKYEHLWSWAGCATLLAASFLLINQESTVIYWALEALTLVVLGFGAKKVGYRLQGLLAFALAAAKLVVWDMSGGQFAWTPDHAFTLYRAVQFGVVGASSLLASFLYFREESRVELAAEEAKNLEDAAAKKEGESTGETK